MDNLKAKLNDALKQAMLGRDNQRRDVVRMALSEVKQFEVDERKTPTDDDVMNILQRLVKKWRESVDEAERGGRPEFAEQVKAEVRILEEFPPAQLSRDDIVALAKEAVAQSGATSAKDTGKVMSALMPKVKGKADGKLVNEVVRELLSS